MRVPMMQVRIVRVTVDRGGWTWGGRAVCHPVKIVGMLMVFVM